MTLMVDDRPAADAARRAPSVPVARSASSWRPFLPFVIVLAVVGSIVAARLLQSDDAAARPAKSAEVTMPTSAEIEATYGVRFTGVDVTAGGGMIQIRYQVLDTDKTSAIHEASVAPYVVDAQGNKYADPGMVGHSHVGKDKAAGTSDFILLANARGGVQPGSTVTIKVGTLELRGVPVQ